MQQRKTYRDEAYRFIEEVYNLIQAGRTKDAYNKSKQLTEYINSAHEKEKIDIYAIMAKAAKQRGNSELEFNKHNKLNAYSFYEAACNHYKEILQLDSDNKARKNLQSLSEKLKQVNNEYYKKLAENALDFLKTLPAKSSSERAQEATQEIKSTPTSESVKPTFLVATKPPLKMTSSRAIKEAFKAQDNNNSMSVKKHFEYISEFADDQNDTLEKELGTSPEKYLLEKFLSAKEKNSEAGMRLANSIAAKLKVARPATLAQHLDQQLEQPTLVKTQAAQIQVAPLPQQPATIPTVNTQLINVAEKPSEPSVSAKSQTTKTYSLAAKISSGLSFFCRCRKKTTTQQIQHTKGFKQ